MYNVTKVAQCEVGFSRHNKFNISELYFVELCNY